jgi:hypothetical protein
VRAPGSVSCACEACVVVWLMTLIASLLGPFSRLMYLADRGGPVSSSLCEGDR